MDDWLWPMSWDTVCCLLMEQTAARISGGKLTRRNGPITVQRPGHARSPPRSRNWELPPNTSPGRPGPFFPFSATSNPILMISIAALPSLFVSRLSIPKSSVLSALHHNPVGRQMPAFWQYCSCLIKPYVGIIAERAAFPNTVRGITI